MITFREWKAKQEIISEAVELQCLCEATQVNVDDVEQLLLKAKRNPSVGDWPSQVSDLLKPTLAALAHRYGLSPSESEDVMQNALLLVTRNLRGEIGSEFQTGTTKAWLNRILHNAVLDHVRKMMRHKRMKNADMEEVPHDMPDPSDRIEKMERIEALRSAIARLPEEHRSVVNLVYLQGKRYQDAADILNIPIGTVKSRMNAAMIRLKNALE